MMFWDFISSRLSLTFGRIIALLAMAVVLLIVLSLFAAGLVMLVANSIGNWCAAFFIIGGAYLVVLAVIFLLAKRKKPEDNLKPMALYLVRYLRSLM